jgi:hypothetical protein
MLHRARDDMEGLKSPKPVKKCRYINWVARIKRAMTVCRILGDSRIFSGSDWAAGECRGVSLYNWVARIVASAPSA